MNKNASQWVNRHLAPTLLLVFFVPAAMAQSPNEFIEDAMQVLASAVADRREELAANKESLYSVVDDILLPRFDRRYAAQLVLGRSWRNASDDQRARFIDAFYASMVRKYADGVLEFEQDRIQVLSFRGDDSKPRASSKPS